MYIEEWGGIKNVIISFVYIKNEVSSMYKWHDSNDFVPKRFPSSGMEGWYLQVTASRSRRYLQSFNLSRACDGEEMKNYKSMDSHDYFKIGSVRKLSNSPSKIELFFF